MPPKPIPEDEEIDIEADGDEEMDEDDMDLEEGMDLVEALGQMLCTEEGDTMATIMSSIKDSAEKIATQLEMQNKILVKVVGALQKVSVCQCARQEA